MSSKKENALTKVQDLYVMQVELWNFLDDKSTNEEKLKHAKKTLKEFKALLDEVDPSHMGGEDVFESLQLIPSEVTQKIKAAPANKRPKATKKVVKKPTAKKTAKKK